MSKSNSSNKSRDKNFIMRGVLGAVLAFAIVLLLMPLLLLRTDDPSAFADAGSVACIAASSMCGAFFYTRGNTQNPYLAALICAGAMCLVLTAVSLIFGKGAEEISYAFSAIVYGAAVLFSALGVYLSGKKRKKKRRK